ILTPPAFVDGHEIATHGARGPVLIVMDKWLVAGNRTHPGWVSKFETMPADLLQKQIASVATKVSVLRAKTVAQGQTTFGGKSTPPNLVPPKLVAPTLGKIEQVQTLQGRPAPLLTVPGQGALLSRAGRMGFRDTRQLYPVYILSDPDILNNHGLADPRNARAT